MLGIGTVLMNTPRVYLAILPPFHQHVECISGIAFQVALFSGDTINCSGNIRSAPHRQIDAAPHQAIHLTPNYVQLSVMVIEVLYSVGKTLNKVFI